MKKIVLIISVCILMIVGFSSCYIESGYGYHHEWHHHHDWDRGHEWHHRD